MNEVASQIRSEIAEAEPRLSGLNHNEVARRPSPKRWSKKEILGHLIDSAANNHQRFVRAVDNAAAEFPTYDQVEWVRVQRHNETPWTSLVALWYAYNDHLCRVIERLPESSGSSPCNIGKEQPVPLDFVVKDYLRHLRHHLAQILEERG